MVNCATAAKANRHYYECERLITLLHTNTQTGTHVPSKARQMVSAPISIHALPLSLSFSFSLCVCVHVLVIKRERVRIFERKKGRMLSEASDACDCILFYHQPIQMDVTGFPGVYKSVTAEVERICVINRSKSDTDDQV